MKNYPADRLPSLPEGWPQFRDADGNDHRALMVRTAFTVTTGSGKKETTTEYDGGYLVVDSEGALRGYSTREFEAAFTPVPV